jgi:transcription antitermination factor NusG
MSALLPGIAGHRIVSPGSEPPKGEIVAGISVFHSGRWESEGGADSTEQLGAQVCDLPAALLPKNWYAVHTRARHEKVVAAQLRGRGVETYLPLVQEIHRWSDRRMRVQVPLFPGYTFIHARESAETVATVAQIESVVRIVGAHPSGTPIPDAELEAVHKLVAHNIPCVNYPFPQVGQRIRICGGALDGVEGTLLALKGTTSLVVSIQLIQRSLAVRIEGYDIEVV